MQRQRFWMSGVVGFVAAGLCMPGVGLVQAVSPTQLTYQDSQNSPGKLQLVATSRFVVLADWGKEAVLDRETGLVWELSPSKDLFDWPTAQEHCLNRATGGRKGWRIPSVHELASLVDPSIAPPGPTLREGHPFINVQSARYWGAAPNLHFAAPPWFVLFSNGRTIIAGEKGGKAHAWCVRTGGFDMMELSEQH
ncbi:MAG: DUF1566 domain-containing protein [Nitrospira sp.]|nr:DUF1566 domain-containing protein [Nitrospira sp.]